MKFKKSHSSHQVCQTALYGHVHCNESLVLFEVSGFYYTINMGFLPGLFSNTLLLPSFMEILQL